MLNILHIRPTALNDLGIKMLPHLLDGDIVLQFRGTDAVHHPALFESVVILIKNNGGHTFILIFWVNANQVEKSVLTVLSGVEQVKNPKREQLSIGLLQGFGKRGHHNGKSH